MTLSKARLLILLPGYALESFGSVSVGLSSSAGASREVHT
jgi:hypothetical protein